jgi:hypothetical protein
VNLYMQATADLQEAKEIVHPQQGNRHKTSGTAKI